MVIEYDGNNSRKMTASKTVYCFIKTMLEELLLATLGSIKRGHIQTQSVKICKDQGFHFLYNLPFYSLFQIPCVYN